MSNAGVIELFDAVATGTEVEIVEDGARSFAVRVVSWNAEWERLREVRHEVFIVEQSVPPELEWDAADVASRHALALDAQGAAVGCARLLPDGSIGRVAVRRSWRGRGVGSAMLLRLMDVARYAGFGRVVLNARSDTCDFYARHGFVAHGEEFMEAGIRHRRMERPAQERS
jgi:predicted GNAT family N-acyltransferase